MPRAILIATLRHLCWWRVLLLVAVSYVLIHQGVPWLQATGLPFWARSVIWSLLPLLGALLGAWLYPRRR